MKGLRYGVALWVIVTISRYLIHYAIQPWPLSSVLLRLAYELVATLLLGEVLDFVARS